MAEGTSLLRMHTAYTCIVGSNPTVSASIFKNPLRRVFSFPPCGDEQSACALCVWDLKLRACRREALRIAQSGTNCQLPRRPLTAIPLSNKNNK